MKSDARTRNFTSQSPLSEQDLAPFQKKFPLIIALITFNVDKNFIDNFAAFRFKNFSQGRSNVTLHPMCAINIATD